MTCRVPRRLPKTYSAAMRTMRRLIACEGPAARAAITPAGNRRFRRIQTALMRLRRRWGGPR